MSVKKDWLARKIDLIENKKCVEVLTLCSKHVTDFALDILVQEIIDLQDRIRKSDQLLPLG